MLPYSRRTFNTEDLANHPFVRGTCPLALGFSDIFKVIRRCAPCSALRSLRLAMHEHDVRDRRRTRGLPPRTRARRRRSSWAPSSGASASWCCLAPPRCSTAGQVRSSLAPARAPAPPRRARHASGRQQGARNADLHAALRCERVRRPAGRVHGGAVPARHLGQPHHGSARRPAQAGQPGVLLEPRGHPGHGEQERAAAVPGGRVQRAGALCVADLHHAGESHEPAQMRPHARAPRFRLPGSCVAGQRQALTYSVAACPPLGRGARSCVAVLRAGHPERVSSGPLQVLAAQLAGLGQPRPLAVQRVSLRGAAWLAVGHAALPQGPMMVAHAARRYGLLCLLPAATT